MDGIKQAIVRDHQRLRELLGRVEHLVRSELHEQSSGASVALHVEFHERLLLEEELLLSMALLADSRGRRVVASIWRNNLALREGLRDLAVDAGAIADVVVQHDRHFGRVRAELFPVLDAVGVALPSWGGSSARKRPVVCGGHHDSAALQSSSPPSHRASDARKFGD